MRIEANTPEEYIEQIPEERKAAFNKLRQTVLDNLPEGFEEGMNYGMIGYYIPHSVYPKGYHVDPKLPLPFLNIANQKNFVGFYHMGIYANPELLEWFKTEYPNHMKTKLDMGKSCIRFKKPDQMPFELLGELIKRMSAKEWIDIYETHVKR
ncbi:MAG: DUF1801 domain-containing protein [Bacteroidetes bacterium]|nr:MAG: DUF1801 domain-containing protein [Bacteroidota bacterium]